MPFDRLEPAEEQDQVRPRSCMATSIAAGGGVSTHDRRCARDAAHPGARRLARHDTHRAREHEASAAAMARALEARAVQLHHQRAARGERRRHEGRVAPEAAARGGRCMCTTHAAVLRASSEAETRSAAAAKRAFARQAAVAVGGDVARSASG